MVQQLYGFTREMPKDIDFYVLSNEDIGFVATMVVGTNDVYSFALPYPSSIDLFDETIIVHAIEFILQQTGKPHPVGAATPIADGLAAWMSMLDTEFEVDFIGNGPTDTMDEEFKAQFAGNIYFGIKGVNVVATVSVEGTYREADSHVQAMYIPPIPLDLVTPLYIQFVNQAFTVTLADNTVDAADMENFEQVMLRVWFTVRKLSVTEKDARNMQIRFQRLDS